MVFHRDKGEAAFYSKSSHPGSQLGSFNINKISKLFSFDWMGKVSFH